jgi:fumarate reductase flavoprotein subunit
MHSTPSELGSELVTGLRRAIASRPLITLVDEAQVDGLVLADADVVGVELTRPDRERIGATSVLLACDGFGGNRDMLRQYCPEIADAVYIGAENNVGDGIKWGAGVGAALDRMTAYQGHSHVNPGHGTRLGGSLPSMGSILVNRQGRRFEREDQGYSEFARVVLAQPDGVAVEIFDQRIFDLAWHNGAFREAFEAGAIIRAGDASELARHFQLPAEVLEQEITAYNAAVTTGTDRLARKSFGEKLEAPLYGSLVTGAIAHTQGGLRIDPSCNVLRPDRSVIRGLLAAGGTAAGISGTGPEHYMSGNGLIQALATGMIAGEVMAAAHQA